MNIEIQNVLSKPAECNALYYSYIKNSPFISEGEFITYPSVTIDEYKNLPNHILNLCLNGDTEDTKVVCQQWFRV